MKVLIWFVCLFIASIIKTLLVGGGSLGAIPTMTLYGAAFAAAKALSTAWENRKKMEERIMTKTNNYRNVLCANQL